MESVFNSALECLFSTKRLNSALNATFGALCASEVHQISAWHVQKAIFCIKVHVWRSVCHIIIKIYKRLVALGVPYIAKSVQIVLFVLNVL